MFGYAGKILHVDLTQGTIASVDLDLETAQRFIGGRGLGAKILWDELAPGVDPLGPENCLVVATGPFAGTPVPTGSRFVVMAKSPLTNLLGDAEVGGYFGHHFKRAGYDALVIKGQAPRPAYLMISPQGVEIRDASSLWGLPTAEADRMIREAEGRDAHVLAIGPAGERQVRYANVMSEGRYAAGRCGLGAVMGAKRLKAIAVAGSIPIAVARPEQLDTLRRQLIKDLEGNTSAQILGRYGTWNTTAPVHRNGILPTRNFQTGVFPGTPKIDGDAMLEVLLDRRETCYACPIRCRRAIKPAGGHHELTLYGGPQYEAVAALGSLVAVDDPVAIAVANQLCNAFGMDVISTGVCIAFAIECVERGVLSASDVGFPLRWGDSEAVLQLVRMIGERQGLGNLLAEGVKRAAEQIGRGSGQWAMHVKGMEMAMHDPRGKVGVGLSMATCHKGPDHMECLHDEAFERENAYPGLGLVEPMPRTGTAGKPRFVKLGQDYWGVLGDSLCLCKFPMGPGRPLHPELLTQIFRSVTGWDVSLADLLLAGERVFNVCRLFNVREGARRADDTLPQRLAEPLPEGATAGHALTRETLETMLDEYYALRGWTRDGVPTPETLERLGLSEMRGAV